MQEVLATIPRSPLLEARGLIKAYGSKRVVDGVSLTLRRGEILGLVGESGSGKSTVARMMLRLVEPTAGELVFHDAGGPVDLRRLSSSAMSRLRRRMAFVFQDPYAALDPRMKVRDALSEPFAIHRERPAGGVEARLRSLLTEVGLLPEQQGGWDELLGRFPHSFSGGQRQRINIARALALEPEILVLDEPVSALDVSVAAQVINLLQDLQRRRGLTCLFISHSMPLVRYLCDRVAVLKGGRLVEEGTWDEVCERPREAYTQQLIAATPELPKGREHGPENRD